MSNFTEMDCYLFGQATHYDIYRKMGAHKMTIEGEEGVCFDVWAPHADRVYVIGEFNGWNETSHEMKRVTPETMHSSVRRPLPLSRIFPIFSGPIRNG